MGDETESQVVKDLSFHGGTYLFDDTLNVAHVDALVV